MYQKGSEVLHKKANSQKFTNFQICFLDFFWYLKYAHFANPVEVIYCYIPLVKKFNVKMQNFLSSRVLLTLRIYRDRVS